MLALKRMLLALSTKLKPVEVGPPWSNPTTLPWTKKFPDVGAVQRTTLTSLLGPGCKWRYVGGTQKLRKQSTPWVSLCPTSGGAYIIIPDSSQALRPLNVVVSVTV